MIIVLIIIASTTAYMVATGYAFSVLDQVGWGDDDFDRGALALMWPLVLPFIIGQAAHSKSKASRIPEARVEKL